MLSRFIERLHRDEKGSISIISVFAVIFLSMVLGMVMNIARRADRKVIMQNGADASTYSGGVVLARSMNTIAFTNHLICDVFGLTAYLREARDRTAESFTPEILQAWQEIAPRFETAPLQKFSILATAIPEKIPLEAQLITAFSNQNAAVSEQLLPVMENVLATELIPEFQRALAEATPRLMNAGASEIAARHGPAGRLGGDAEMRCWMWRSDAQVVSSEAELGRPTLPAVDPLFDLTEFQPMYVRDAIEQRERLSNRYLQQLNSTMLPEFDQLAKMGQFSYLWRGITCAYLDELLDEYPDRNLLFQLRDSSQRTLFPNAYIEEEYLLVGVCYWEPMPERLPGLFQNPIDTDDVTFSQIRMFIPRNRILLRPTVDIEQRRQGHSQERSLLNQHWTIQLVPATLPAIPTILESSPPDAINPPPNLGGINLEEFHRLNTH